MNTIDLNCWTRRGKERQRRKEGNIALSLKELPKFFFVVLFLNLPWYDTTQCVHEQKGRKKNELAAELTESL